MKKLLALLLALSLCFALNASALAANVVASGACGDNLTWTLDDEGTLTISGVGAMWDFGNQGSPWYDFNEEIMTVSIGSGITTIGNYAFQWCHMTSVQLPDGVTSIGKQSFYMCSYLTDFAIPASVAKIGSSAFGGCKSLTYMLIPEGVTSIEGSTFTGCNNLAYLILPDSLQKIEYGAFYDCFSLKEINIPNGVTKIGEEAFYRCNTLTSLTIPASVVSIAGTAIQNCKSLIDVYVDSDNAKYQSIDGVLFQKSPYILCYYPEGRSGEYKIPEGVTEIFWRAFGYAELSSLFIPASVTSIGVGAFCYCNGLTDVYYSGTEEQWNSIEIGTNNDSLLNATIHFNFVYPETHLPGDLSGDGEVTDADAIYLLYHIFFPEQYPTSQPCDFNGDGVEDDADAIYLLYHVFFPDLYPIG